MKAYGLYLSVVLIVFAGCGKEEKFTPEMLGERVVIALNTNDKEAFSSYFITPKELHEEFTPKEEGFVDYYKAKYAFSTNSAFDIVRKEGQYRGVDWGKAKFNFVQYKVLERDNIQKADIYVFFTSVNDTFVLKLDDCHPVMDRGWRLFDDITFENYPFVK